MLARIFAGQWTFLLVQHNVFMLPALHPALSMRCRLFARTDWSKQTTVQTGQASLGAASLADHASMCLRFIIGACQSRTARGSISKGARHNPASTVIAARSSLRSESRCCLDGRSHCCPQDLVKMSGKQVSVKLLNSFACLKSCQCACNASCLSPPSNCHTSQQNYSVWTQHCCTGCPHIQTGESTAVQRPLLLRSSVKTKCSGCTA